MRPALFTPCELTLLRASDRVVDRQEPGRDRRGRRVRLDRMSAKLSTIANGIVRDMQRARGAT